MATPQVRYADITYEPTTSAGIVVLADADFALIQSIDALTKVLRAR